MNLENLDRAFRTRNALWVVEDYLSTINTQIFQLLDLAHINYKVIEPYIYNEKGLRTYSYKITAENLKKEYDGENYLFFHKPLIDKTEPIRNITYKEEATRVNLKTFVEALSNEVEPSISFIADKMLTQFYSTENFSPTQLQFLRGDKHKQKAYNEEKFHKVFDFLLACKSYFE